MNVRHALLVLSFTLACGQVNSRRDAGIASRIIFESPQGDDAGSDAGVEDAGVVSRCIDPQVPHGAIEPCRCHSDCADGTLCSEESELGEPQGACKRICQLDGDCHPSETCRKDERTGVGNCMPLCTASSQCGLGRYCLAGGWCVPRCQLDTDCRSGTCDTYRMQCVDAGFMPMGKRSDEPCLRDDECRSGLCITHTCFTICAGSAQACPDDEFCFVTSADQGWCRPRCQTTAQCLDPTTGCINVVNAGRSARICI
jgi:hypothetical protein